MDRRIYLTRIDACFVSAKHQFPMISAEMAALIFFIRGVVIGVAGVASTTPTFEKIKGTCIKMLHLKYIFTP